jgi:glycosyltransferase involved in cell wall biosynthesis
MTTEHTWRKQSAQATPKGNSKLIFVTSTGKGDALFRELKKQYSEACYIPAGPSTLPQPFRSLIRPKAVRRLLKSGVRLDSLFQRIALRDVKRRLEKETPGFKSDLIFWFPWFAVTSELSRYGRLQAITDVAMDDFFFEYFGFPPGKSRLFRKSLYETNYQNCQDIFTLSQWAADSNKRLFPEYSSKIRAIGWGPNVVPASKEQVFGSFRQSRILCIGHDYYRKGADLYNEVARRLKKRIPNLECLMVGRTGKGLDPGSLDSLTCRNSLPPAELTTLYRTSKFFLLLSRFEPSAHVVLEAMSFGLPVICTTRGGSHEPLVESENGFACDPEDIDGVVARALCLLENPAMLESFGQAAYREATERWQWQHVAQRLMRAAKKP